MFTQSIEAISLHISKKAFFPIFYCMSTLSLKGKLTISKKLILTVTRQVCCIVFLKQIISHIFRSDSRFIRVETFKLCVSMDIYVAMSSCYHCDNQTITFSAEWGRWTDWLQPAVNCIKQHKKWSATLHCWLQWRPNFKFKITL